MHTIIGAKRIFSQVSFNVQRYQKTNSCCNSKLRWLRSQIATPIISFSDDEIEGNRRTLVGHISERWYQEWIIDNCWALFCGNWACSEIYLEGLEQPKLNSIPACSYAFNIVVLTSYHLAWSFSLLLVASGLFALFSSRSIQRLGEVNNYYKHMQGETHTYIYSVIPFSILALNGLIILLKLLKFYSLYLMSRSYRHFMWNVRKY